MEKPPKMPQAVKQWMTVLKRWRPKIIRQDVIKQQDEVERHIATLSCWHSTPQREAAIQVLGELGDVRAVTPLIHILRSWHGNLRLAAIIALRQIGEPAVEPLLWTLLDTSASFWPWRFRQRHLHKDAATALRGIGIPAVAPLIRLLGHDSFSNRAAEILCGFPFETIEPFLVSALNNESTQVRRQVINILEHADWIPDNDIHRTNYWVAKAPIDTIIFDHQELTLSGQQRSLHNPECVQLRIPMVSLKRIVIHTETYNFHLVERFLTYAINVIGQKYLKKHVEAYLYGDPEKFHPNLSNNLTHLCKTVYTGHPKDM